MRAGKEFCLRGLKLSGYANGSVGVCIVAMHTPTVLHNMLHFLYFFYQQLLSCIYWSIEMEAGVTA